MKNVNTKRNTESDIRIFKGWLSTVGELLNPKDIGVEELKIHLGRFFFNKHEIQTGLWTDSLKCIQASISRYLSDDECWYSRHRVDYWKLKIEQSLQFLSVITLQSTITNKNSVQPTVINLIPIMPNSKITIFPYSNIQGNLTINFYGTNDKNWTSY